MDVSILINKLKSLMVLDVDAIGAYDKAIENIFDNDLKTQISLFRTDHERHVDSLETLIKSLGGVPPERKPDMRGAFLGGLTSLQGIIGTEGALKALQGGEKLTNKDYGEAVTWDVSPEIHSILEKNYSDEQKHLRFVNNAINDKVWLKKP
jgi:uncharacterized protein (TIGR02284 family)